MRDTIAECLAKGLTGAHEPGLDLSAIASYTRLIERGQFPFRVFAALSGKKAWGRYRDGAPETVGDGRLVVGAVKLWLDGALGSRGAALHSPYCDDPANTGLVLVPPEDVERLTREVSARGFHVWVHAIGDRANTMVLDVFERVRTGRAVGGPPSRLRVEHAQILTPADVPRFARLGVVPSMQPTHCTSDMRWAGERLGPERLAGAYAWRSVLDSGAYIAGGSDFPVEDANPFHGLHAAVTRRPLEGADPGWQPEQRMTRDEAVRSFTIWNARSVGLADDQGSLEVGRRADLIALSDDVFTCDPAAIARITPTLTMVGGEVVAGGRPRPPRQLEAEQQQEARRGQHVAGRVGQDAGQQAARALVAQGPDHPAPGDRHEALQPVAVRHAEERRAQQGGGPGRQAKAQGGVEQTAEGQLLEEGRPDHAVDRPRHHGGRRAPQEVLEEAVGPVRRDAERGEADGEQALARHRDAEEHDAPADDAEGLSVRHAQAEGLAHRRAAARAGSDGPTRPWARRPAAPLPAWCPGVRGSSRTRAAGISR